MQLIINDKQYTEYKGHTSQALMLCSVLLRRRFGPSYFALPTRFYVHECHQNDSETSHSRESVSLFQFPSEGKRNRRRQAVHDHRIKGLAKLRLEDLRICAGKRMQL